MKHKKHRPAPAENRTAYSPFDRFVLGLILVVSILALLNGAVQCYIALTMRQYGVSATGLVTDIKHYNKSYHATIEFADQVGKYTCDYSGFINLKKGEQVRLWYHSNPCSFTLGMGDIASKFGFTLLLSAIFGITAFRSLKKGASGAVALNPHPKNSTNFKLPKQ